jgi:hypothetical protein
MAFSINTIGGMTTNYSIKDGKISAHGFDWTVVGMIEFEHKGEKRIAVKVKKPRGRRTYEMVIFENGAISEAY